MVFSQPIQRQFDPTPYLVGHETAHLLLHPDTEEINSDILDNARRVIEKLENYTSAEGAEQIGKMIAASTKPYQHPENGLHPVTYLNSLLEAAGNVGHILMRSNWADDKGFEDLQKLQALILARINSMSAAMGEQQRSGGNDASSLEDCSF